MLQGSNKVSNGLDAGGKYAIVELEFSGGIIVYQSGWNANEERICAIRLDWEDRKCTIE